MSFYISYTTNIENRQTNNILFFKEPFLCSYSKVGIDNIEDLSNVPFKDFMFVVIRYIELHRLDNVEILLPDIDTSHINEMFDIAARYLEDNDVSIGFLTKEQDFIKEHQAMLDGFGVTYSLSKPEPEIIKVEKVRTKPKPKIEYPNGSANDFLSMCATEKIRSPRPQDKTNLVLDEPFNKKLMNYLIESDKSNVEVYTKGGISRQVFSKVLSDENSIPTKQTIISLIVGMELNYKDAVILLESAGYSFSKSMVFDVVVAKFIKRGIYDLDIINDELNERNCPLLGWHPREK